MTDHNMTMKDVFSETVNRRTIIREAYDKLYHYDKGEHEEVFFQSFHDTAVEKLDCILNRMGINMKEFQGENNKYEIPILIADIFKIYISQSSKKGSCISKYKLGDYDKITYEEINELIDLLSEAYAQRFKNMNDIEGLKQQLEEATMVMKLSARYVDKVRKTKEQLIDKISKEFDEKTTEYFGEYNYAKIVAPSIGYKRMEQNESIKMSNTPYLNLDERMMFLDKLLEYSDDFFEKWEKIIKLYDDVKDSYDVSEKDFDSKYTNMTHNISIAEEDYVSNFVNRYNQINQITKEELAAIGDLLKERK